MTGVQTCALPISPIGGASPPMDGTPSVDKIPSVDGAPPMAADDPRSTPDALRPMGRTPSIDDSPPVVADDPLPTNDRPLPVDKPPSMEKTPSIGNVPSARVAVMGAIVGLRSSGARISICRTAARHHGGRTVKPPTPALAGASDLAIRIRLGRRLRKLGSRFEATVAHLQLLDREIPG